MAFRITGETVSERGRFEDLYLRHADRAVRLAYVLTGDRPLAEDLTQEAFIRLAGRFAHLRDPSAFDSYLRRTIVNLARAHFRRQRIEARVNELWHRSESSAQDPVADLATHEAMRRAISRLPFRQRAAIVLRFYEDLSYERCAEVMRCRSGTVRSLVSRALTSLRGELGEA